jgi:hypothetical protein
LEAVAEAGMGVDEAAIGESILELVAQLRDVNVDGAIAMAEVTAPDGLIKGLPGYDRPLTAGHGGEQFELPHGQGQRLAGREHEALVRPDLELPRIEDVGYVRTLLEDSHDAERPTPGGQRRCKVVIYR